MLINRISKRVPSAKIVGRATLLDWMVNFSKKSKDGSGKANLLHKPGFVTWGSLYTIDDNEIDKLDKIEKGYNRIAVSVKKGDGEIVEAETYISDVLIDNPVAFDSYKEKVILGANENNFPKDYVQYLQNLPSKPEKAG
jgi:hypothetical protein